MANEVVVITGASAGIGAAVARRLAPTGRRLVLAARRGDALRAVADEVRAAGGEALAVETDVTRRDAVMRLRDEAVARFGHVDVWINNAGRGIARPVLELDDAAIDEIIAINVKSALYGMQAVVPHFIERGTGHLINVSSFLGRVPAASMRSVYSAAKAMLNSLTANLRMDLRPYPGIHVSLVMPGLVSTEFARNALHVTPATATPPATSGGAGTQTPQEVAEVIARLIDEPRPEVYTNPVQHQFAIRYVTDPAAVEAHFPMPGPPGQSAAASRST